MTDEDKITIDEIEYAASDLSDNAKSQISSIKFVDEQLQQLHNELAVADTARIGYTKALKAEAEKSKEASANNGD